MMEAVLTDTSEFNHRDHILEFVRLVNSSMIANISAIDGMVDQLVYLRRADSRLFIIGLGGGAANAAHAVNDFRKLCGIEAYAPTDGIAELTARANDDGLDSIFVEWLRTSRFGAGMADTLLVFSVGGGTDGVSAAITRAVDYVAEKKGSILAVVGRTDGAAYRKGSAVALTIGPADSRLLTPVTETLQIAVLHALVSDPRLQRVPTKW